MEQLSNLEFMEKLNNYDDVQIKIDYRYIQEKKIPSLVLYSTNLNMELFNELAKEKNLDNVITISISSNLLESIVSKIYEFNIFQE
jgi:hypothetical protein